eukprot:c28521_g1_i3 orf=825-2567(+)
MDSKESRTDIGEAGGVVLTKPTPSRPTLVLPSRFPADVLTRTTDASPSPMTLVSSFFADHDPEADCKSYSQLLAGAMTSSTPKSTDSPNNSAISSGTSQINIASGTAVKDAGNQAPGGNGDAGVARSSTARFKTMTPSRLPIPRSPYLTIPPGLSPTTLLDSPVLLSTAQAEPSPTTGSFPLPPFIHGSGSTSASASDILKEKTSEQDHSPSFVFKPFPKLGRNPLSTLVNMGPFGFSHQQVLAEVQAQAHAQIPSSLPPSTGPTSIVAPVSAGSLVTSVSVAKFVPPLQCKGPMELTSQPLSEKLEKVHLPELPAAPFMVERPSEDGYNWRKYGQKQVKGSEYPRSYYKCTYPNCPVKKKVERAHDGQVTEIVYKGEHNHVKPQSTRRMSLGTAHISDGGGRGGSLSMKASGKADGSNAILGPDGYDQVRPPDLKSERAELVSDPSSSSKGIFSAGISGTPEISSVSTSDDEGEDCSKAEDRDIDEPDSKRRKKENDLDEAAIVPLRTIREPRVVVQTTSDIDILDDGYRWRKYGQKVVKGNPHPRSYYKCTNLGCSVRKHVERSSTDPRAVITTYEGK